MIKFERTVWAMSQHGIENSVIAVDLSARIGKDITPHVVAVNIGRFQSKIEKTPEKVFDSLIEDCKIEEPDTLAQILGVSLEDAEEIAISKFATDEHLQDLIEYYDENIADENTEGKPVIPEQEEDEVKHVVIPIEDIGPRPERTLEDYATDDDFVRIATNKILTTWQHNIIQDVKESVQDIAIPLAFLGKQSETMTLEQIQKTYQSALNQLRVKVVSELQARVEHEIESLKAGELRSKER